jgi:hypothetical protein
MSSAPDEHERTTGEVNQVLRGQDEIISTESVLEEKDEGTTSVGEQGEEAGSKDDKRTAQRRGQQPDHVIKNIGRALENTSSCFTCSGSMTLSEPVCIYYKSKGPHTNGACDTRHICLPTSDTQLQDLMHACDVASFGIGDQEVVDETYRKALCLPKDRLASSFELYNTDILRTIQSVLAPDSEYIVAQSYKLNIYEKDGFFKSHKDTPRGGDMFGSLVISLPQEHTGGDLTVRHMQQVCCYSPLPSSEQANSIQWMAFYSDCDHEVHQVLSGTRITLTFNLYRRKKSVPLLQVQPPIDQELLAAMETLISDTDYHGRLGLLLEHLYVSGSSLKGKDLIVFNTATCLAKKYANVEVKKYFAAAEDGSWFHYVQNRIFIPWKSFHKGNMVDYSARDEDENPVPRGAKSFDVDWVRNDRRYFEYFKERPVAKWYGNDPEFGSLYSSACLLVRVSRHGSRGVDEEAGSDESDCSDEGGSEEACSEDTE